MCQQTNKQKAMKVVKANISKIVTTFTSNVECVNGQIKEESISVKSFKTKEKFFDLVSTLDCISGTISVNKKGFIKKMTDLGFEIEINNDYGIYENEAEFYAYK